MHNDIRRLGMISALLGSFLAHASHQPTLGQPQGSLRLMTFNILVKRPMIDLGARAWKERGPLVAELIRHYMPDVIGLQEVTEDQKLYLERELASVGYASVGLKRAADQKIGFLKGRPGEYALIFYNVNRVMLNSHETIWLNETGQRFTTGWDAKLPRIATIAQFTRMDTHQSFVVCNMHLALEPVAQRQGARMVAQHGLQKAGNMPLFILGDFNMTEQPAMQQLQTVIPTIGNTKYVARNTHIPADEARGGTRVGWKKIEEAGYIIDHIFANNIGAVINYAIPVRSDAKKWRVSDHRPVLVDVEL